MGLQGIPTPVFKTRANAVKADKRSGAHAGTKAAEIPNAGSIVVMAPALRNLAIVADNPIHKSILLIDSAAPETG